ncbi:hypothetical protein PanWU01x14_077500 [Parasponia andersonii]|uniref:Transmembrane protein n=1 Tax=Parasponia andersonii TaxID=3476 RepID=A0A2P5DBQ4_PARAD|nr:hypothetical protein PanWU01x14_077500 [Parasponia andersonii]
MAVYIFLWFCFFFCFFSFLNLVHPLLSSPGDSISSLLTLPYPAQVGDLILFLFFILFFRILNLKKQMCRQELGAVHMSMEVEVVRIFSFFFQRVFPLFSFHFFLLCSHCFLENV